jgi:cobalt/nickel transport system permease protein
MHIPNGFIDGKTALTTGVLAVAALAWALQRVRATLPPQRTPLLGLAAAFIFAAQMLNFPVAGGTSGHLIGGALAAILLGPAAALVSMSAVIVLQGLLFNDGGVTALGANLFNMAVIAPVVAWLVYQPVQRLLGGSTRARLVAAALAAWCSTVVAALACAGQLAWSGTVKGALAFPAMGGIHALIGIGEALITALILRAVAAARPDLLAEAAPARPAGLVVLGLLAAVGLVVFVAPFACAWPDGLEKVAAQLGFEHKASATPWFTSPLADYQVAGLTSEKLGIILAGLFGILAVFVGAWAVARMMKVRSKM